MKYISTRGGMEPVGFQDAVMTGLARDGGLLLPDSIPDVSDRLEHWASLSYAELAFEVMAPFTDIPEEALRHLVNQSYSTFRHDEVTPLVTVGDVRILELFHGPTLAFKDLALQFLGNLFEYILEARNQRMTIVGATSGDTGSAAIYGVRGRERMSIFIMHPRGRVSPTQEKQMTSVLDDNVFNMAIEGTFDDCQSIVKALFNDLQFRDRYRLGAINSINWARVLAQIVYYFYAGLRVMRDTGAARVRFSVPTGNFGDIFAGYMAARMGLPVGKLILATNENDILSRFFNTGRYSKGTVSSTLSPSMDIQVASNFERYLYYHVGEDPGRLSQLMDDFSQHGALAVPLAADGGVNALFEAAAGDTAGTLETIRRFDADHGYLLDPHTAVGVHVGLQHTCADEPLICLATAHPAKFGGAIRKALGRDAAHHPILDELALLPTRCDDLPGLLETVRDYVSERAVHS